MGNPFGLAQIQVCAGTCNNWSESVIENYDGPFKDPVDNAAAWLEDNSRTEFDSEINMDVEIKASPLFDAEENLDGLSIDIEIKIPGLNCPR